MVALDFVFYVGKRRAQWFLRFRAFRKSRKPCAVVFGIEVINKIYGGGFGLGQPAVLALKHAVRVIKKEHNI